MPPPPKMDYPADAIVSRVFNGEGSGDGMSDLQDSQPANELRFSEWESAHGPPSRPTTVSPSPQPQTVSRNLGNVPYGDLH